MAFQHRVTLTLLATGTSITVWDGYQVAVDMFSVANPWTFSLWHTREAETISDQRSRRTAWRTLLQEAKCGDLIKFSIDNAVQMVGVIRRRKLHGSRKHGHQLVLSGRDVGCLATDPDASPNISLRNTTLNTALQTIFRGVGLSTVFGFNTDTERQIRMNAQPGTAGATSTANVRSQRVDLVKAQPGDRVWTLAEKVVRKFGYLMWIAPTDGQSINVVVDVPNYAQDAKFVLKRRFLDAAQSRATDDTNILDGELETQIDDVPSDVSVFGRQPLGDVDDGRLSSGAIHNSFAYGFATEVSANAPPLPRYVHGHRHRSSNHAQQEAMRIIADANRSFRLYRATVQGHGQTQVGAGPSDSQRQSMRLYPINTMVHVRDALCGLPPGGIDEAMLIQRVEFTGSRDEGQHTHLTCGTSGAIALTPTSS